MKISIAFGVPDHMGGKRMTLSLASFSVPCVLSPILAVGRVIPFSSSKSLSSKY
jgi:hypothetical protein